MNTGQSRQGELFEFLRTLKGKPPISSRSLSGEEIKMAEELTDMGLLDKTSTRLDTFYNYGAAPDTEQPKGLKDG